MSIHTQRVLVVRTEELVQRVRRCEAALRGDDVGLGAGVGTQVVRHQLVDGAVQAAESRLHRLPHLRSTEGHRSGAADPAATSKRNGRLCHGQELGFGQCRRFV